MDNLRKILIAEDEAHIMHVMTMWLERHGFDVLQAYDGREALDVLRRSPIDAVITDLNMPVMDGRALVRAIREELESDVPILLLTARCDQDRLACELDRYHIHLYPKPFMPSKLVTEIQRLIAVPSI